MDALAAFAAGGAAILGTLVAVIGYLLVGMRADRSNYEAAIDRAEARADAAEQRARDERATAEAARDARHRCEEQVGELRAELAALRRRDGAR